MRPGPTGDYPRGKLNADDEGGLLMGVAWDPELEVVVINFGKPVAWIGMDEDVARQFVAMIEKQLPKAGG